MKSILMKHRHVFKQLGFLIIIFFCFTPFFAYGSDEPIDMTELSIEDLMNLEITSVSKKSQSLIDAAAAVFVITQEDIRRSGVTSIPEALRMAPGIHVSRIDANKWAITSRGFNGRFANKLLVLIDGRSVYTSLFSGVYWDVQDTLLEDIERIEVIRGPGATLWGANAVNGVINIITKHSSKTQGALVTSGFGTEEKGFGSLRYGARIDNDIYFRAYAKYFNRDEAVFESGKNASDGWHVFSSGFRMDWDVSSEHSLTVQGDFYSGMYDETVKHLSLTLPFATVNNTENDMRGGNLLLRWAHDISATSDMSLQVYYDWTRRNSSVLDQKHNTFDIDFQHQFAINKWQDVVWGLSYRFIHDSIGNSFSTSLTPGSSDHDLFSVFVQDDIKFLENRVHLTLGSKFEHNDFTGLEIQPNIRLLWSPYEQHRIWAAVSRAVRTPARIEIDGRINSNVIPPGGLFPGSPVALIAIKGSRSFESEDLIAYELGYRILVKENLSADISTFYNVYDNLRTLEPDSIFPEISPDPPHLVVPAIASNKMKGKAFGVELAGDWQIFSWLRLQASYSYLQLLLRLDQDSKDTVSKSAEGQNPHHQLSLRTSMSLLRDVELDMWFRYVGELPSISVKSYATIDTRLCWKPHKNIELSLIGQNLLDTHHPEFKPDFIETLPTEVERSIYGKITWKF